ncbi:LacI family DNA-binding transcriptional regulator [Chloroflexota bacterium]
MPATLKDIANRVGKSITTVSRALNDYDDISPETKQLVRQAAAELGYIPSAVAQRLQKRRTDTLGFILPTFGPRFSDPFFSEFLAGIGNKASLYGFDLLVSTRTPGKAEMDAYQSTVKGRRVDGFIIVRTRLQDARIKYLSEAQFPFVVFGRVEGSDDFLFVDEDSEYGVMLIVDYLLKIGHRRFGVITPPSNLTFTHYRLKGIRKRLAEAGVNLDDEFVFDGDLTQRGGYQLGKTLLAHPNRPTAIIACNDLMAYGAMSAAQELGLVVGKDISITGFDDIPMSEHMHPPLTTLHQPIYKIGEMVCEMLIKSIRGEQIEQPKVILRPELMIRQSCGAVAG